MNPSQEISDPFPVQKGNPLRRSLKTLVTQTMGQDPAVSSSPRSLEKQTLGPRPRPTESESPFNNSPHMIHIQFRKARIQTTPFGFLYGGKGVLS